MWIKLNSCYYNLNHIRKISVEEIVRIEYSNGEAILLYGLTNDEVLKLIKYIENDSITNSRVILE